MYTYSSERSYCLHRRALKHVDKHTTWLCFVLFVCLFVALVDPHVWMQKCTTRMHLMQSLFYYFKIPLIM